MIMNFSKKILEVEKFSLGPVTVPAFITFTEGGGIDGTVLRDIFRRLDALKLFDADREKGLTPFVLLDGHQSRFDVEFLTYINQKKTNTMYVLVCHTEPHFGK